MIESVKMVVMVMTIWFPPVGLFGAALAVFGALVSILEFKGWRRIFFASLFIILGIGEGIAIFEADADHKTEIERLQGSIEDLKKNQQQTSVSVTQANSGIAIIQHQIETVQPIPKGPSVPTKGSRALLHIVNFEVLPAAVGKPIYLNVNFENIGQSKAEMQAYSLVGTIPNDGNVDKEIQTEEGLSSQLPEVVKKGGSVPHEIASNSKAFFTVSGPVVASSDELTQVLNAKIFFLLRGHINLQRFQRYP